MPPPDFFLALRPPISYGLQVSMAGRFGLRITFFFALALLLCAVAPLSGAIRDGGVDPDNLGKGEWVYSVMDATNRMGGHVPGVTNLNSMMLWYKSQGVRYLLVKAATSDKLYNGCLPSPQFNTNLVQAGRTNGIFIFGYNRSYGSNILGEIAISDYVFQQGADGFVWDAEAEWETGNPWITNGPAQAWALCSAVRSNWPTKFLAHAPFPIIYFHYSFPYKEFGYWSDAVMPQIYHFSSAGIKGSPSAAINWSDVNWHRWHNEVRALPATSIGGLTVYWTNAIKPLAPVHDVYGTTSGLICNGATAAYPDDDVMEFIDYLAADPHCPTAGGYNGVSFWRTDLHGVNQLAHIKAGSSGDFPGVVKNVVMDDNRATYSGAWTAVRTFSATSTTPTNYTALTMDTNSFGTNYFVTGQGSGNGIAQFAPAIVVPGDYNVYEWHPYRTNSSTNVPFIVAHALGTNVVYRNQTTNSGRWTLIGRFPFNAGTGGKIRVTDGFPESNAVALIDGLKLVFVMPSSVPQAPTGLAASSSGSTEILLAWSDLATNETGYIVARSTNVAGIFSTIAALPANAVAFTNGGLAAGTTYYYRVRATNYLGASPDSNTANASTPTPPAITAHPIDRTVVAGSNVTFAVAATGTGPLRFQWRFLGTNVSGATNISFTRTNAQPLDSGAYSVAVLNSVGTNFSSNAVLTVLVPPSATITLLPDNRLRLFATGAVASCAIQFSTNLSNWTDLTSVTNSNGTFTFSVDPPHPNQIFYRFRLIP